MSKFILKAHMRVCEDLPKDQYILKQLQTTANANQNKAQTNKPQELPPGFAPVTSKGKKKKKAKKPVEETKNL